MEQKKFIFKKTSKSIPIPGDKNSSQSLANHPQAGTNDKKYHYIPRPMKEPQEPQTQAAPPPPQIPQPPKVAAQLRTPPPPQQTQQPVQPQQAAVSPLPQASSTQMRMILNNTLPRPPIPPQQQSQQPLAPQAGGSGLQSPPHPGQTHPADPWTPYDKAQGASARQTQQEISHPPPKETSENPLSSSDLAAKTSVLKGKLPSQPGNEDTTAEIYREQLQNYLELCDSISSSDWTLESIIDVFYVMVESLELDSLAIALIDFNQGKSILPIASRGFRNLPGQSISGIWNEAIIEGPTLSWNKLMVIAAGRQNDLTKWIGKEGLDSIGYVPIHDNKTIFGFIFIGTHDKTRRQSPIASPLLELCGGRIGLTIALRKFQGSWI